MKYPIPTERIPQDQRKEINEKILYLIESNTCEQNGITPEEIYSAYTGKGSLHNLNFDDFDNYHEYSEAKKIEEVGQFFTPSKICKFIVDCVKPSEQDLIADLTYGMGNFFNFCPNEFNCHGTELDSAAFKVARYLYSNANLENEDIRLYDPKIKFDIVFGNPPFNLWWKYQGEEYLSQLFYFFKAFEVLKPGGLLALIVPSSFLKDDFQNKRMINQIDEKFNFIIQCQIPKNSFKDFGVSSYETKIMFFQKKSESLKDSPYRLEDIVFEKLEDRYSDSIYNGFIKPILEEKKKLNAKLILENLSQSSEDKEFQYKVKKCLWDIRNSKHTKKKYAKAMAYVNEFYSQEKPKEMEWEEWEKVRITETKVLNYLKKILKNQHLIERDEIRLVKDNYGLRLKAYSRKSKIELNKIKGAKKASFNEMVLNANYGFDDLTFKMLVNKKNVKYLQSNLKFKDLDNHPEVKKIQNWIEKNPIYDHSKNKELVLTPIQNLETAKHIFKGGRILNFEQGSGKTLCAITFYRYFKSKVHNTIVIGPSIAIKLNWIPVLENYKENFIVIDSLEKIEQIQKGQTVLISFDMVRKYERHIKRFVKVHSNKFTLIVDESDELTNYNSKRTKVTRNCFRKVKYKLLTTGTTTRNNINELYAQLELLYNNSIGMLCECPSIYKFNAKEGRIDEKFNDFYMKPFPAYFGNGLFKSCFNPYKQTVFGIKKHNQDIYNSESLINIIERTITTRSFFEITGKKPEFETIRIKQNPAEEYVYGVIINEFHRMMEHFKHSGNSKKESMLKIIRQIQLLIKATSVPQFFKEYNSDTMPGKQVSIFKRVGKYSNEKVAVGTIFKPSVKLYFEKLKAMYPDRQVFLIEGKIPFKKRKLIIAEFEKTKNGILVATQQSLKSSVNIGSCDKVMIESLMWNLPKISQFYMRFVRYDSVIENKKIHFFLYEGTLEMNLLALLMDKERLNDFIKVRSFKDRENIFQEYGIDFDLIEQILEKVKDKDENKVKIAWGKQKIA